MGITSSRLGALIVGLTGRRQVESSQRCRGRAPLIPALYRCLPSRQIPFIN